MIKWYDDAIVNKLRSITGDDRIAVVPPESLFRYIATSTGDDRVKAPMVALTRLDYTLTRRSRTPASSQGVPIGRSSDGKKIDELQFIPVQIDYQLDIITRNRDDNDLLTSEIIFYFTNHPTLLVEIGKGANVKHKFSIFFNETVEDNSDIESHISKGEYFRSTLSFYTTDAYLWKSTKEKPVYRIDPVQFIATTDMNDPKKDFINETISVIDKGEGND